MSTHTYAFAAAFAAMVLILLLSACAQQTQPYDFNWKEAYRQNDQLREKEYKLYQGNMQY